MVRLPMKPGYFTREELKRAASEHWLEVGLDLNQVPSSSALARNHLWMRCFVSSVIQAMAMILRGDCETSLQHILQ